MKLLITATFTLDLLQITKSEKEEKNNNTRVFVVDKWYELGIPYEKFTDIMIAANSNPELGMNYFVESDMWTTDRDCSLGQFNFNGRHLFLNRRS